MRAIPIPIEWNPNFSIFASEPFLRSVGDEYGWLGGFDASENLRCILPYTIIRKAIFRLVRFRVETILVDSGLSIEDEKNFLSNAVEYFNSIKAGVIIPATTNTIFRTFPDGAYAAPYGTYIIKLDQPEDEIFGNFSSSHRRKVRVAQKSGVRIKSGLEYLETAYALVRETFGRSKMSFMSLNAFRRMVEGLGENIKILVAIHEEKIQACVVLPFSRHCAYYVYGGSIPKPISGATNLLHWEAMRLFRDLGVKRYDFVGVRIRPEKGSKQEGLKMFKERFGGQLVQGFMWKYPLRHWHYRVYDTAVRFARGGDIVDLEKHKLKADS